MVFVMGEMLCLLMFLKVGGDVVEGVIVYMGGLLKEKMLGFFGYVVCYKVCFNEDVIIYLLYLYDGMIVLFIVMKDVNLIDLKVYMLYFGKVLIKGVLVLSIVYDVKGDLKDVLVMIYKVECGVFKLVDMIVGN